MSATVERVAARCPSNPRAQWAALTARFLRSSLRSGELVPALVGPVLFTALFYVPLQAMMSPILPGAGGYGNFLGPLILLQAMAFVAMTGGYRAALDVAGGLDRRLATLPMHRAVPPLARICATSARSALGLAVAVTCARVVGFRLLGSPVETAIFLGLTAATAVGLVVATDAIGTLVARPEVIAQALMVPQLLLGVLSTGVAPIDQFPPGLRGFVAAQPVSCLVDTLRTLAAGQPTAWIGAVGWIGGLWAVGLGLQVFSGKTPMTTVQPTGTLTVARVEAGRLLRRALRDPVTTGEAVVFPVLLLVVLETVFGRRITALTGVDALLGLVPMAALLAVMNSSPAAAVALRAERDGGVLARLWVHPVRRGGLLLGRALAEIGRSVVIVLVVFAAGVTLGLRVSSPWSAAVMLLLSVLWAAAYAMVAVTVALNVGPAAEMLALPAALLAFFSTGFVPLEAFPTILQPIVARQPITVIVDAMRTVAGGAVGLDVWGPAALWSLALGAVFCVPAARAFRRASRWTGAA